ncbi:lamin tail domain-containing protein [Natronococcus sp. A-GB7]|uniref:lamin tail domain-containing protein n=1 Tax=Natronococcus sp. A-GB7 TaxID=3037649 RepID=UPI00241E69C2|nr:lamin tail domain-containing protein [Natronococcus sp. A-GB7]MDG5821233.1 lamin tail domain-containing protein [Natronococcus sp. A-GB7]
MTVDVGHASENEYILFENTSDQEIDLGDYEVTDREAGTGSSATFPSGFTLDSGEQVRVTSGPGSATDDEIFTGSGNAVWKQDGDIIVVNNPSGNTVLEHEYGNPSRSLIGALASQVTGLFS